MTDQRGAAATPTIDISDMLAAEPAIADPASPAVDAQVQALRTRRRAVRHWWNGTDDWAAADGPPPIGLALSGGGIRSATFSLGLLQALAKSRRDALLRIDVLSTVSGGGYIGAFLRSLFVPPALRGIERKPDDPLPDEAVADQFRLARAALRSRADARELWMAERGGGEAWYRNPIWWLREHSRYLAPTGPTDYSFAAAYIMRNWLAMVYLFALACAALATPLVLFEALLAPAAGWARLAGTMVSPVAAVPLALVGVNAILALAYWATQGMSTNEADVARQWRNLRKGFLGVLAGAGFAFAGVVAVRWWVHGVVEWPQLDDTLFDRGLDELFGIGAAICLAGALFALAAAWRDRASQQMLTAELRLHLTKALSRTTLWLLVFAILALLDSLAAHLAGWITQISVGTMASGLLFPGIAYVIKKIPDWLGGTGGGIGSLIGRFASKIALLAGLVLYGLLAIGAMALIHHFAWSVPDEPWHSAPRWPSLIIVTLLIWTLAFVSGRSTGFINLSSLHALYSARLTRAFFGASNVGRLRLPTRKGHPRPVTENDPGDYIQPRVYGEADLPAPIHIVNVTLNETQDPRSQIVTRDRKGDILTVEPGGIRIGAEKLLDWHRLANDPPMEKRPPENISLGQWVAISGAAASSAMGRMTNLGYAIAFTFANVRLGYWWHAPGVCPDVPRRQGLEGFVALHFATFVYLLSEIACRYSRGYDRKYLTDGGHYENSGAYALIRRRVPLILVSDNGADPDYAFEDLQTLVRQVRLDLGGETTILEGDALAALLAGYNVSNPAVFVDPAETPDWKAQMRDPATAGFALVLRVRIGDTRIHLIWVKPRLLPDLPADVAGYAATMKPFPQQPTGDQFFDEAQWESYRRLGEETMSRLLRACPGLLA